MALRVEISVSVNPSPPYRKEILISFPFSISKTRPRFTFCLEFAPSSFPPFPKILLSPPQRYRLGPPIFSLRLTRQLHHPLALSYRGKEEERPLTPLSLCRRRYYFAPRLLCPFFRSLLLLAAHLWTVGPLVFSWKLASLLPLFPPCFRVNQGNGRFD